jgi:hypothetical protein
MLLGGKGGCQQCTCVPCDACTRTCQNPYTGTEFKPVYTRYFEGVEAGDPSDGYLSASGDSDTSDPYNGMDGSGPWSQQVSGSFTLDSTQTRFPCRVTISFWRNQYGVGVQSIPPPSTALTFQGVFVTVTSGAVRVGDQVIMPEDGEVQITTISIPLVTGSGDQSANDPLRYEGGISVTPTCESASFSIRATITWNTQRRQHVLYGLVRECYEEGTPCATFCNGSPAPEVLYVTISNYTGPVKDSPYVVEGTYVLERIANTCDAYSGDTPPEGGCLFSIWDVYMRLARVDGVFRFFWRVPTRLNGECDELWLGFTTTLTSVCPVGLDDLLQSGDGGVVALGTHYVGGLRYVFPDATFDWKIEL